LCRFAPKYGTQQSGRLLKTVAAHFSQDDLAKKSTGDPEDLRETNRQLTAALKDCYELLDRTKELLRRAQQDTDPPNESESS
jgi:uncharacterized membrane protein YccC